MFTRFRVKGKSMEPNFREGDFVLVNRLAYFFRKPKIGDAVIVRHSGMLMLKRIRKVNGGTIYLAGDSERGSKLAISKSAVVGKVMFRIKKNQ